MDQLKTQVDTAKEKYDNLKTQIGELETKKSQAYRDYVDIRKKLTVINAKEREKTRQIEAEEQRKIYASTINVLGSVLVGVNVLKKGHLRKWTGAECTGQINNDPDNANRKVLVVKDLNGNIRQVVMATFTGHYSAHINGEKKILYMGNGEYLNNKDEYDKYLSERPNLSKIIADSVQFAAKHNQPALP